MGRREGLTLRRGTMAASSGIMSCGLSTTIATSSVASFSSPRSSAWAAPAPAAQAAVSMVGFRWLEFGIVTSGDKREEISGAKAEPNPNPKENNPNVRIERFKLGDFICVESGATQPNSLVGLNVGNSSGGWWPTDDVEAAMTAPRGA